tara:strand:- start:342 stop:1943 length:1602 start_codon:yes stop_codon:yes gene_type:complete
MSLSPLSNISGINEIVSFYEQNKDKNWDEWLSFHTSFDKPGKQGLVGLLKLKNCKSKKNKCVFKISQYINHLVQHESCIIRGLNDIASFCPHYCKFIGNITTKVDPKSRKEGNPFNIESKYPIEKDVLLCEYINNSYKFYNYIKASEDKISEDILYSTVKQVLLALSTAQKNKKFTHYDLHSFNIMMKRCNKNIVFLYVNDEENQFAVPTFGHYPIIIDFGFSYIEDLDDGPLWCSMGHTNVGFLSDRFDWVADPKLFLITVSNEIKMKRKSKKSRKLRRIVRNIFHPLNVDWESGWDEGVQYAASDHILELVSKYNPGSVLFEEYEHYCIDLLLTLIILPLEEQSYDQINMPYEIFLKEFIKIENQISSPFYNLYILKTIVDTARYVRAAYLENTTRKEAINTFKKIIGERIQDVVNFCKLSEIHFEKMLCSLLNFSRDCEGVLYDILSVRVSEKEKEYKKLPLKSCEQMYGAIEVNIPTEYTYTSDTTVVILDSLDKSCNTFKIPSEELSNVNSLHNIAKGTYIYDLYKNK